MPALEAVSGVPVEVAAVGPVPVDDVLDPRTQKRHVLRRDGLHARAQCGLVVDDEMTRLARVLGAVEVVGMPWPRPGEVMEAIPGPEVRRAPRREPPADALREPLDLRAVVDAQEL